MTVKDRWADWLRRPVPEVWASVRAARVRARLRRERFASIRTLNLEAKVHGELLTEMAKVLRRHRPDAINYLEEVLHGELLTEMAKVLER